MENLAVELSVIDRLEEVVVFDLGFILEVGDGARDAEDFVVSAGGEAHLIDVVFHQVHAFLVESAVFAKESAGNLRVIENSHAAEAFALVIACAEDFSSDGFA